MRPVPVEVRRAILIAVDDGEPRRLTAVRFKVSTAFLRKLIRQRRDTGDIAPLARGGGRQAAIKGAAETLLRRLVKRTPDATVAKLSVEVGASTAATCRALQRLGLVIRTGRYDQTERGLLRTPVTRPVYRTKLGKLYEADCLDLLPRMPEKSGALAFVDAPFNAGIRYGRRSSDRRDDGEYLDWCRKWMAAIKRVLRPGGSLMLWHIPRWAMRLGTEALGLGFTFRSWIATDFNLGKTMPDRPTARHLALLWFTNGFPATFNVLRLPIQRCRKCSATIRDYGGKLHQLHADGPRVSDIWTDIHAVRHGKYKHREVNELPTKLIMRCIQLATRKGDVVLDPMAGTGTVSAVCEELGRYWLAIEIEETSRIIARLQDQQTTLRSSKRRAEHH